MNIAKLLLVIVAIAFNCFAAQAQTSYGFYYGFIPTAAQWNSYFAQKQDYLGYIPLSPGGVNMTGRLVTAPPSATLGGFNLAPGATPSAPANGDIWATATQLNARIGGVTYTLNSSPTNVSISLTGVNFNLAGDTEIQLALPVGFTRYLVNSIRISNASHSLTTATVGAFTAAAGAGIPVVTAATAITVSATADATNNNAQSLSINNASTESYLLSGQPSLFLLIATPQGAAATATVTVSLTPLP